MASVTEELKELVTQLDRGLITRAEFDEFKAALLARSRGDSGPSGSTGGGGQPREVGAYRVLSHVGDGGMGSVYRAQHRSSQIADRQGGVVAIKVMHPHIARSQAFGERFEREAGLGLKLDHPGIVKVHDLVMDGGVLALVMELVEGQPLSDMIGLKTGPIPWTRARPMFEQLLESVDYLHQERVVHRDIKPENVRVTPDGRLRLLDLGIAKDSSSGNTRTGAGLGTVDYMAPEQHTDAGKVDGRADVYALGMTLYEMLAGQLPWGEELDPLGILQRKLAAALPPPTDYYPDIPEEVVQTLMAALAPEREQRTASVRELGRSLQDATASAERRERAAQDAARQAAKARAEAQRRAEEAERRRAEAEARQKAEAEARRRAEEQVQRRKAEEKLPPGAPRFPGRSPAVPQEEPESVSQGQRTPLLLAGLGLALAVFLLGLAGVIGWFGQGGGSEEVVEVIEEKPEPPAPSPPSRAAEVATPPAPPVERVERERTPEPTPEPTPPPFKVRATSSTPDVLLGDPVRVRVAVSNPPQGSCKVIVLWWDKYGDPKAVSARLVAERSGKQTWAAGWTASSSMVIPKTRYQAKATCGRSSKKSAKRSIKVSP